jgi:hypothetical protein
MFAGCRLEIGLPGVAVREDYIAFEPIYSGALDAFGSIVYLTR